MTNLFGTDGIGRVSLGECDDEEALSRLVESLFHPIDETTRKALGVTFARRGRRSKLSSDGTTGHTIDACCMADVRLSCIEL